jgi:hypothetical protein
MVVAVVVVEVFHIVMLEAAEQAVVDLEQLVVVVPVQVLLA